MIYLLERKDAVEYDEYDAKIVRAKNPEEARAVANRHVGDEGRIWINKKAVSCRRIKPDAVSKEIMASFRAG